jgi:hypothetical protein
MSCAAAVRAGETVPAGSAAAVPPPTFPLKSERFDWIVDDEVDQITRTIELFPLLDILDALHASTPEHLAANVDKAADFRQIYLHPEQYRGHVVAFNGTFRYRYEESLEIKGENDAVRKLDRGQISSGGNLISVISTEPFPKDLKPGDTVRFTGVMMQRFAYINDRKPGVQWTLTPLIVVQRIEPYREEVPSTNTGVFVGYIVFLMVGVGFFLLYNAKKESAIRRGNYFRQMKIANGGGDTLFPGPKKNPGGKK